MRPILRSIFVIAVLLAVFPVCAQGLLPDFSVKELTKGKIQISWNNPYRNCVQLAIQRSQDSSKNFRTIFSSQSPELASNGYVDNRPIPGVKNYYRIFYAMETGAYFFTRAIPVETQLPAKPAVTVPPADAPAKEISLTIIPPGKVAPKDLTSIYLKKTLLFQLDKKAYQHFKDSINSRTSDALRRLNKKAVEWIPVKKELYFIYQYQQLLTELNAKAYLKFKDSIRYRTKDTLYVADANHIQLKPYIEPTKKRVFIYRNDSLLQTLEPARYRLFRDSVSTQTKDTLYVTDNEHVKIHAFVPKYVWKPSDYIFTNNKGYVTILLPLVKQHKYQVIFYEEDGSELFRIKTVKEPELILDKTDFVHSGWFYFELFEDDQLKEKNKFFLPK